MFKRIQYLESADIIAIVAFVLSAGVFLFYLVKAFRMTREQADYMSKRPLEDDYSSSDSKS